MGLPDQLTARSSGAQEDRHALQWRLAQERMLLYLSSLGTPPEDSLAYALEAITQAKNESLPQGEPISEVMCCLRGILRRNGCLPAAEPDFSGALWHRAVNQDPSVKPRPFRCAPGRTFRSLSLPPARRDRMPAASMQSLKPWRHAFAALRTSCARLATVATVTTFSFAVLLLFLLVKTLYGV